MAKVLKLENLHHFFTEDDDVKAAMVKQLNRTVRDKMHRYMTRYEMMRYVDALNDIIQSYKNLTCANTGMLANKGNAGDSHASQLRPASCQIFKIQTSIARGVKFCLIVPAEDAIPFRMHTEVDKRAICCLRRQHVHNIRRRQSEGSGLRGHHRHYPRSRTAESRQTQRVLLIEEILKTQRLPRWKKGLLR